MYGKKRLSFFAKSTAELSALREQLINTDSKPVEFEGFRKQAGLNSFVLTPETLD